MEKPTAISKLSALLDTRGARSIDGTRFPNIDALYGPYISKDEAWETLSEQTATGASALVIGKTVGILDENGHITEYWFKRGCTYKEDLVEKAGSSGGGSGDLDDITQKVDMLMDEVFPLTVAVETTNAGNYEVGSYVNGVYKGSIKPNIKLKITRNGSDIASLATVTPSSGQVSSDNKTITDSSIYTGSKTINVDVSQNGQTKRVSRTWSFMNYVYGGEVSSKPANPAAVKTLIETTWANDSSKRTLSQSKTKTSTPLAANKYYVFAVNGIVNLVVRDNATSGIITGCDTDTVELNRVNGSGSDTYTYVIVEKSSSAWNFKITNN